MNALRILFALAMAMAWGHSALADGVTDTPLPLTVLQDIEQVGDYLRLGAPTEYGQDDLWEYINGGAALFVSYDFITMATASYAAEGDPYTASVDVYLVPDGLRAFGLYSRERGPRSQHVDIGAGALVDGPSGRFYKGPYYVKVKIMPPPPDVEADVESFMRAIEQRLPGNSAPPEVLSAFQSDGLVDNTLVYVGTDLLGHVFLRSGFLADYDLGAGDPARAFIFIADSAEEAESALGQLREFFEKRGKDVADLDGVGDAGFTGSEPFYGPSLAFSDGPVVAGAVRIPGSAPALEVLCGIVERLRAL